MIEQEGLRVLTTTQLAESFCVDAKIINRNFQRNRERYEQGKHFFSLAGEALKEFKALRQNDATLKFASILYLWTEQGAWMLAKSLNNNKAWKAYEMLVDSYFKITKHLNVPDDALQIQGERIAALEAKVANYERKVILIEQNMNAQITLHSGEQRRLQLAVAERVYKLEKQRDKHAALFRGIYSALKKRFSVKSYRDVKRHELQMAIRFVEGWND